VTTPEIQFTIRQKLFNGILPKEHSRQTWYGPGTGGMCAACDRLIEPNELEVDCDLGTRGTLRLHHGCHEFWLSEWSAGE
jgi:hypothetical protein